MLVEQGIKIGREPLVQPGMGPVFAGEQIAKPLVRQLMGHQAVAGKIEVGALVVQRQIGRFIGVSRIRGNKVQAETRPRDTVVDFDSCCIATAQRRLQLHHQALAVIVKGQGLPAGLAHPGDV
jgi:hypothetical protein